MTHNPLLNIALATVSAFCLAITEIDMIDLEAWMTVAARFCTVFSFIIILVSNWGRFRAQIKLWREK